MKINAFAILAGMTLFAGLTFLAETAEAQLVITVGSAVDTAGDPDAPLGPFTAGSQVTVPVFAHFEDTAVSGGITDLTGFQFPIDLGGDGEAIPGPGIGFFSSFSAVGNSSLGGSFTFDPSPGSFLVFDFLAELSGSTTGTISTDATTPTLLFEILFDTDIATTPGIFDITIPTGAIADSQTNVLFPTDISGDPGALVFDNGQFEITSVPEPGALTLVASLAALYGVRRRSD